MPADGKVDNPAGEWASMRDIRPRSYICHHTGGPIKISGKLDDPAWQAAPWTEDFVDIEGSKRPVPRFRTRAKMLWDDEFLFVGAELADSHVVASITQKN